MDKRIDCWRLSNKAKRFVSAVQDTFSHKAKSKIFLSGAGLVMNLFRRLQGILGEERSKEEREGGKTGEWQWRMRENGKRRRGVSGRSLKVSWSLYCDLGSQCIAPSV